MVSTVYAMKNLTLLKVLSPTRFFSHNKDYFSNLSPYYSALVIEELCDDFRRIKSRVEGSNRSFILLEKKMFCRTFSIPASSEFRSLDVENVGYMKSNLQSK